MDKDCLRFSLYGARKMQNMKMRFFKFRSCIFMPWNLVRRLLVFYFSLIILVHFQSTVL